MGTIALYNALKEIPQGLVLEFGVAEGNSLRLIAKKIPDRTVYGFDSFEGLPETWRPKTEEAGCFKCEPPKDLPPNTELVVGLFQETLPKFMAVTEGQQIAFVHIDCDLYSSTKTVLNCIKDRLAEGAIIVFDEILGYEGHEEHEYKAFAEFIKETQFGFECIGRRHDCDSILRISK